MYDVYIIGTRDAEPGLALMLAPDGLTIVALDGATGSGVSKPGDVPIRVAAAANDSLASVPIAAPRVVGPRPTMIACREGVPDRRLVAIFAADAADYSRLMRRDEVETFRVLTSHRETMETLIVQHRGRIANTAGDSVLAEFPSAVDAVRCAAVVQERLAAANGTLPDDRRLLFRIGVHVGDVMIHGSDLFGDGVNMAARLQAFAEPGGLCLSAEAHTHVRAALSLAFEDLGQQQIRNSDEPVRVYSYKAAAPRAPGKAMDCRPALRGCRR